MAKKIIGWAGYIAIALTIIAMTTTWSFSAIEKDNSQDIKIAECKTEIVNMKDSLERIESKLDALLQAKGVKP